MPDPTLLLPSKVKILPHYTAQDIRRIQTMPAKDYIMRWFSQRIPSRRGGIPLIKSTSMNDRVFILQAGTGSGKSVTLGPELYFNFFEATSRNIAVTQPRILTSMSIPATIVGVYPRMRLGVNIGYQTGDFAYTPRVGVVFMTIGVLSQQLKTMSDDEFMAKYAFVVIDECHDRSVEIDMTLGLMKQFLLRNFKKPACPFLILTSATFDTAKYARYFLVDPENIVTVEGLNYPIKDNYLDTPVTNYVAAAVSRALDIHRSNPGDYAGAFTDVLIFVYGGAPLKEITAALDKANAAHTGDHFVVIALTGATFKVGDEAYRNIFKPLGSIAVRLANGTLVTPKRRIIVATNVAETGVTIDTLKYLIDTGYENSSVFDPVYGSTSLIPRSVTQASAVQRKGRVGRLAPGEWYPLYTAGAFATMPADKFPDMMVSDISAALLGLIVKAVYVSWDGVVANAVPTGRFDIEALDLMDYPSTDGLISAIEKLFVLGMIDSAYVPTSIGLATTCVTKMTVESVRMVLAGYQYGANILDLITIAAFVNLDKRAYVDARSKTPYTYETVFKRGAKALPYYDRFFIADDFVEAVFIWEDFMDQVEVMKETLSINHVKRWCKAHGLVYAGLVAAVEMRDALIATFIQGIGLDPYYNGAGVPAHKYSLRKMFHTNIHAGLDEVRKIKRCVYEGYRLNTATWEDARGVYVLDASHEKVKVTSTAIKPVPAHETIEQTRPKKIVCASLELRANQFSGAYQFECTRVSALDAYVDVDETFSVS